MKKILSIILFAAALFGCSNDRDLYETIIIYDKENPDLPIYSEWGYNTFGAYFDREVFISNTDRTPMKITSKGTETTFTFTGDRKYAYSDGDMTMYITISGIAPKDYAGLSVLDNKVYDLTSPDISVEMYIDGKYVQPQILNGTLFFKRYQKLFVDKEFKECILSGVFEMQLKIDGENHTISEGRFDIGLSKNNFYVE